MGIPIIQTKLHRPPVAEDIVCREALHARLDAGRSLPLTLVSAPAGYGKSTLISHWLETCGIRSAWLSLDEGDSDIAVFLHYFVAAVRTLFSGACREVEALLNAAKLQPARVLFSNLSNDLAAIEEPFFLALDDYHFIQEPGVHELLDQLLKHPPRSMHLVIITRRNPPLSLYLLRARHKITEIRIQDLEFSREETAQFLKRSVGCSVEEAALAHLQDTTEGWPVGLRLAILALRHRSDVDEFLRGFSGDSRWINDYLVSEILSHQPPEVQDSLCKTSILNRFCTPLCEAVCDIQDGQGASAFLRLVEDSGLLCVALDECHEWYRFHHLFQELLRRRLEADLGPARIAELHQRAASWFEENGLIEEALHHALASGDSSAAIPVVSRHRHDLMNREEWQRLERWLSLLPPDVIDQHAELSMLEAWLLWNRMRIDEMATVLDRVESLVARDPGTDDLQGEIDALRSIQCYLGVPCDPPLALVRAQQAVESIPRLQYSARSFALIMLAMSYQMTGDLQRAFSTVFDAMKDKETLRTTCHTRLLITLCFIHWLEGDLSGMQQAALQLQELVKELELPESEGIARYFLGVIHYCRNEPDEAVMYLSAVVKNVNLENVYNYSNAAFVLALALEILGRSSEARETAEQVVRHALDTSNTPLLHVARAFQAELAVRQGRTTEAHVWARSYDPEPFRSAHRFYVPQLTLVRILLTRGTAGSRKKAKDLLSRMNDFYTSTHNTRVVIEVMALQALLQDDEKGALERLGRAITLAQPGGFLRPFTDLGSGFARLLNRLDLDEEGFRFIGRIQASFKNEFTNSSVGVKARAGTQPPVDALTKRELEILQLLANRLSNREIGARLYISLGTVKRHTENIYHKLGVHNRRDAVAKAQGLGLYGQA